MITGLDRFEGIAEEGDEDEEEAICGNGIIDEGEIKDDWDGSSCN